MCCWLPSQNLNVTRACQVLRPYQTVDYAWTEPLAPVRRLRVAAVAPGGTAAATQSSRGIAEAMLSLTVGSARLDGVLGVFSLDRVGATTGAARAGDIVRVCGVL